MNTSQKKEEKQLPGSAKMAGDIWNISASEDKVSFDEGGKLGQQAFGQGNQETVPHPGGRKKDASFDLDACTLISSPKWLRLHGLKEARLHLSQILSQIGFMHREEYVSSLRKPVSSQYAEGLFSQFTKNGKMYNLTASREQLSQFVASLTRRMKLYKQRLDWLTSGSRQMFGVIQEHSVALVLDFGSVSKAQFDLCCDVLCAVLREQVAHIATFHLIRAAAEMEMYPEKAVHSTRATIDSAMGWIRNLEHKPSSSQSSAVEAVLKAMSDKTVEAVYLFAAGDFKEAMVDLLTAFPSMCPVHTVSFNAKHEGTIKLLKDLSHRTAGRFHAFAEMFDYAEDALCIAGGESGVHGSALQAPRRPVGGVPPGAGVREDVFLIWREMEEARNTLAHVQALVLEVPQPIGGHEAMISKHPDMPKSEDCVSSRDWLRKYGLKAQKLLFYDALGDCAFPHSDGVVDVKSKPADESLHTDAEKKDKLVNAKYCDKFAHTKWRDGSVVHMYITAEKCKWYEGRMKTALDHLQKRLDWLQTGSRELFGTVLEDQVYVLIDTSESMKDKLPTVKDKIFQLMQEQLRHKSKVNFVKFDSRAVAWRDRLAEVNEHNLENAWLWVKGFKVGGSTDTLGALRLALADPGTHAVYLLSDGRPDQPPKTILAQMHLHPPVPIHSISFHCADLEASRFLHELSKETGGRFHCYQCDIIEPQAPQPFVSEDTYLLKKEMEQGKQDLDKALKLQAECVMLDWYHNGDEQIQNRNQERPHSASMLQSSAEDLEVAKRALSALPWTPASHRSHRDRDQTHRSKDLQRQKLRHAAYTRSSLLRFLSNGVGISGKDSALQEWMLPETQELFKGNLAKQSQVLNGLHLTANKQTQKKAKCKPKESLDMSSARWLQTNGLVARRLTIMDALAPTAVPQTAKYIPILDKHVCSKVFDEILPLAYVSNSKKRITLVNPQAVNLEVYKEKLKQALKSYESRLNGIVWRALTQEERDKFHSAEPVPFTEHKEALLQALDRLGWPIPEESLSVLEGEIAAGQTYLQQASDLQKLALETHSQSQEGNTAEEKIQGSNVFRASAGEKRVLDTLRGQRVIARAETDGFYYPGTVTKCIGSKKAVVSFSNGDTQITPPGLLIPIGGALACPPLQVGDFVFVRSGTDCAGECWVPGVVIATPKRGKSTDKFYTVLKYNNKQEVSLRSWIVKTSQTRYALTCRYIRECQMISHTIPSIQSVKPFPKDSKRQEEKGKAPSEQQGGDAKKQKRRRKKREQKACQDPSDSEETDVSKHDPGSASRDEALTEEKSDWDCDGERAGTPPRTSRAVSCVPQSEPHSRTGSPRSDTLSTPLSSRHSEVPTAPSAKPASSVRSGNSAERIRKLEDWAEELEQALAQHREQQELIQKHVKDLVNWKIHEDADILDSQKQLAQQQQELLERLTKQRPLTSNSANRRHDERGVSTFEDIPEYVKNARQSLPKLTPGEKLLARWSLDGWYCPGAVVHSCGDQSYFVQNNEGELERIWREDLITDADDAENIIQVGDPVIGLHPLYPHSYCPGAVLQVMLDMKLEVRYYDGTEALVPRDQAYLISTQKFERDVAYLLECEARWVGQPVVARDDGSGAYHLGEVHERVGDGKHYVILWADGSTAVQSAAFIFGRFTRSRTLTLGDRVLALAEPASLTYLPGVICGFNGTQLVVTFCNGKSQHVEPQHCFWLSGDQFNEAVQMYNKKHAEHEDEGKETDEAEVSGSDDSVVTSSASSR
ncbi:von Willebrand factor A domain-containing protein 3B-like isoform X2 [Acipenser ruthenus]|uniref:von Willebrand factor A domain-containing protein 3B-like isoform X2 n=1 Tax=Acipenser ruthenus TaxID=7906 RepID=UPI002741C3D6|nr:von Willebrand factor A domain-containing protein 3B-like isoform X2 [Acipenser ruthenus]